MGSLLIRFGSRDESLRAAILAIPSGARSRAVRNALRLVFLGPSLLRDLANALGALPDSAAIPISADSLTPVPTIPADVAEDFFAGFYS